MRRFTLLLALGVACLLCAEPVSASAQNIAEANTRHAQARLISALRSAHRGETFEVGVRVAIAPGWHIYWRNPGDTGLATRVAWTLPSRWSVSSPEWPTPTRFLSGGLVSFGYQNVTTLLVSLHAPANAALGPALVRSTLDMLVCRDMCIPETDQLSLPLTVGSTSMPDSAGAAEIAAARASLPRELSTPSTFSSEGHTINLVVRGLAAGTAATAPFFTPEQPGLITYEQPQTLSSDDELTTFHLQLRDASGMRRPITHLSGIIDLGARGAYRVSAWPASVAGLAPAPPAPHVRETPAAFMVLWQEMLLAMAGGLILNLMPCVFPILSMKAAGLLRSTESSGSARSEGALFFIGVLCSFLTLASIMIALRGAGADIGWGFHLQSPAVVAFLALLMLAVALNLSGVFEFDTSMQRLGGKSVGAFGGGVLAVAVAAPCTAPLMAPALAWALTQPAPATLAVFAALAIGFALPFAALCFSPPLLRLLPRPGVWMVKLRSLLAFPMFGAAAWLAWVFAQQQQLQALPLLFAAGILLALAAWFLGEAQRRARPLPWLSAATLASAATLVATAVAIAPRSPNSAWIENWTPERQRTLLAAHTPTFVEFTAAWCVTCQVNETAVLNSPTVALAFRHAGAAYLRGDWTSADPKIAIAIAAHHRSGVPLYLMYGVTGNTEILPQLLTTSIITHALESARLGQTAREDLPAPGNEPPA